VKAEVATAKGVPRWFTLLLHLINKRHCEENGHHLPLGWDFSTPIVCIHCGAIVRG
jgi:hypothetical protein